MPSYPFLSDEWLDEARKIRAEYEGKTPPIPHTVRMNLVVTAVPFSEDDVHAHMDTSSGELILETGHIEDQDLKVTVDWETAKAILVEGNPQAGMQAFMSGKVRVEGDMAKLMALQATPAAGDTSAAEMAARLREITSDGLTLLAARPPGPEPARSGVCPRGERARPRSPGDGGLDHGGAGQWPDEQRAHQAEGGHDRRQPERHGEAVQEVARVVRPRPGGLGQ